MVTKYFRFNMSDDNEDTYWGYATGSGEYSSETVSLDKIPYDEATGIIRSWLKNCGAITNTLEIDNAVARAFSKGSTSAVFHYDNGEKYRMTIETADNPVIEWEDFKRLDENTIKESKFKSVESFGIHEFEQQIRSFLKENIGLSDNGQLTKRSPEQDPKPNSFYSIPESGSIQGIRFEISTDGQYYDDIIIEIYSAQPVPMGCYEILVDNETWIGKTFEEFEKDFYEAWKKIKSDEPLKESLYNNDDNINNLISKIEVYKDIVSNSWIPMPWKVAYSKVPEGLKLTIDTDEWFDEENPLGRLIDFILDIYNSDYDSSVRELTGIDIYSDVEFLGGEKSGYATYLIKSSKLDEATVAQAKRFASRKHGERGQVRKATGAPYIVHPEGVAKIVKDFGGDDEQIQAAWLHDTMEDTGTWEEDLREKFGDRVADLVSELTNDDFAIRSIGKEDYMSNKLVNLSDDALLIKLSDFLYNIKDYCPMKTLERMKKNLEALNFSGRKLDDKCDRLLIDCLKAIDEEM